MIAGTIIANVLCWLLMLIYLRRSIQRISREKTGLEPVKEQVNQLIIELDQTTERNIQLIENRIEELKKISNHAGKQISLLQGQKEDYSRALDRYRELGRLENPLRQIEPEPEDTTQESNTEEQESPRDKVLALYSEGLSLEQIAQETGIPQGEVELIITMRNLGR